MASTVLAVPKREMIRLLHTQQVFSDRFVAHMLGRNARLEADLVDHLFNSSEKQPSCALLLLARYGKEETPPTAAVESLSRNTRQMMERRRGVFDGVHHLEFRAAFALVVSRRGSRTPPPFMISIPT